MDLPQSDCGLFPLGFIYLHASSFPFLMVNIFIIKSTLSDCFPGPDLPRENQPAEAKQAYETDIIPQEDPIQPWVHAEPRRFLSVWLLWLGEALCRGLDVTIHHGLPPSEGEGPSLRLRKAIPDSHSDLLVFMLMPFGLQVKC